MILVEFAVDDVQKLKVHKLRVARTLQKGRMLQARAKGSDGGDGGHKGASVSLHTLISDRPKNLGVELACCRIDTLSLIHI